MNTCESAIKIVTYDKRKWLSRLSQTATEVRGASLIYALVTHMPPGQKQAPNPTYLCKWNVETSYRSPFLGQRTAKSAHGGAGTGSRKKRMPFCNGTDNHTGSATGSEKNRQRQIMAGC